MKKKFNINKIIAVIFISFLVIASSVAFAAASSVTRSFSTTNPTACSELPVTLTVDVTPPDNTAPNDFYIIDEILPAGWTVSIPGSGDTSQPGHIKWAVLSGAASTNYQYTVTVPCAASGIGTFFGEFGFGSDTSIRTTVGQDTVDVQVAPVLTTITVSPADPSVTAGQTQQFTATALDQFGSPIDVTITWSSSDTNAGTIDPATGLFTAVASGSTTVTATSGAISGTSLVTVIEEPPVLTTITVAPVGPSIQAGATQQFTATALDQFGNSIDATIAWSSSDETKGTIDSVTGLFTAVAAGTTTVTASSGTVSGSSVVTVTEQTPVLTTITVSPVDPSVTAGQTQQFTATALDQFGNPIDVTIAWSSSDETKGTIDPATGVFTAVAAGTTTVTATSGSISGTSLVTVTQEPPVLTTITLIPANPTVELGKTLQFSAELLDQYGNPIQATLIGSSSDPSVGTIDNNGLFTALSVGTTIVTATSGTISGSTLVTVVAQPSVLTTITVSPADPSVTAGQTQQFTATALDQFGNPIDVTIAWSSSDTNVGTIDPSTGLLTAVASGSTTVTAASGAISGTSLVTVTAEPPVLTTITIDPVDPSIQAGATQQFTTTALDQFGNPIDATVTWSSSDETKGTINPVTGLFTAVAAGTTTVTASSGTISGSSVVTVTEQPPVLTTITISPVDPYLTVGQTQQFLATTLDQFGNPIAAEIAWLSSNTAAGTIDQTTGLFTAVASGTTTITATSGAISGTTQVTVGASTTPLSIISEFPTERQSNVPLNSKIVVEFNNEMDWTTIYPGNFVLRDNDNQIVDVWFWLQDDKTAVLSPKAKLKPGTTYSVYCSKEIKDTLGNDLSKDYSWSFSTAPLTADKPTIVSVSPSPRQTDVPTSSLITITFDKEMDWTTIYPGNLVLKDNRGRIVDVWFWLKDGKTAVLSPKNNLREGAVYTVHVSKNVKDTEGNSLGKAKNWKFYT